MSDAELVKQLIERVIRYNEDEYDYEDAFEFIYLFLRDNRPPLFKQIKDEVILEKKEQKLKVLEEQERKATQAADQIREEIKRLKSK